MCCPSSYAVSIHFTLGAEEKGGRTEVFAVGKRYDKLWGAGSLDSAIFATLLPDWSKSLDTS